MAAIVRSAARLSRRRLLRDGAAALAGALAAPMLNFGRVEAAQGIRISSRAVDLVLATTVVDMLGLLTLDWTLLARWLGDPEALRDGDYRGLERTGVDVFHPAVETNDPEHPFEAALRWTTGWNRLLDGSPCFLDRVADPWDLTGVPSRGERVTLRRAGTSGAGSALRSSQRLRTARSTIRISNSAKAAPRQRRMPPPNGIQE